MVTAIANWTHRRVLMLASGFVSNGPGASMLEDGFGEILTGALFGAFGGLLFGMVSTHLLRFSCYCFGKHFGGSGLTILSMALGALACGWLAATDGD